MYNRLLLLLQRHSLLVILLLIATPLMLIRLADVPFTWYDEGLNLNATRTLAEKGVYALSSNGVLRLSDPALQTGPPLIIPLALIYQTIGSNLAVMRLTTVLAGLAALAALYGLAYRLYGVFPAFLTGLMLLLLPGESTANFILLSRQVLGEIPAVLCIALGMHLMMNPRPGLWRGLLTGLLFGLAITLKSQVLLILTITIGLWTVYRLWKCPAEWRRWGVIISAMMTVYLLDSLWRFAMAGTLMEANSAVLREGILIHILPFRFSINLAENGVLFRLAFVLLTVAALIFIQRRQPARNEQRLQIEHFLMLFVVAWVIWYAFVSIGWRRYAFIGQVFTLILLGQVLAWGWRRWFAVNRPVYAALVLAGIIAASALYIPILRDSRGTNFFTMMDAVDKMVPPSARIVTWEWPASYFSDRQYIYPSTHAVNSITQAIFFNTPYDSASFDTLAACPDYLLLGSFDVDRLVFDSALTLVDETPVFSTGQYELYTVPPERLVRSADGTCAAKESP